MNPCFFDNVFVQEVGAGGHQRDGIQRAAPQVRGIRRVCRRAVKAPGRLDIRQRAVLATLHGGL
jgi:hypothetical protein